MSHTPVLLHEVIEYLDPKPGKFIIDGTMDGGGHARAIVEKLGSKGTFLGIDWDLRMVENAEKKIGKKKNVFFAQANYADIPEVLKKKNLPKADGLFLDLGFSSEQLENSGRGFSFEKDEPLVMTYDDRRTPLFELLRGMKEQELTKILYDFGGERFARRIARAIVVRERSKRIETTQELVEVIRGTVPGNYAMRRLNPATRTFQALRIYANDELGNLEKALQTLPEMLKKDGRAVIISFHSLEDRLVKNYFRTFSKEGTVKLLTKKPVVASRNEQETNPRSRSAKLRACSMISSFAQKL
ncbi:MAG: 16S rRNA (cytosine(1402)-N(4))-methyltransferase RsmH [Patescibacteria group bacterium]